MNVESEGQASPETEIQEVETPETESVETTPVEENPESEGTTETSPPQEAEYTPNYEFRVHDEVKEFDDWAKQFVKDKQTEQQMREVMEKVHGIDKIKSHRDELKEKLTGLEQVQQKYAAQTQSIELLNQHLNQGNLGAFFKSLKIPEQAVMNWAAKQLQYYEMSAEDRAEYDRAQSAREQAVYLGQQNQDMQAQLHAVQHQQRMLELDTRLSQPGVAETAQAYDTRMGTPGSFKQLVQERGLYHAKVNGVDIPVEQAVSEVMKMIGQPVQAAQGGQGPQTGTPPQAQAPKAPAKKPVIPQVEGTGMSATRTVVKSLDDIRKLSAARAGM